MVLPAGFEPAISTVRGWHPRPLDDESEKQSTPAWTRTMNLQLRRLLLYPLSYWSTYRVFYKITNKNPHKLWFCRYCIFSMFH